MIISMDFAGNNNLAEFSGKLVLFGANIKAYSDAVIGVNVTAVSNAAEAVKKIVSAVNSTAGVNTSGVNAFTSAVDTLGQTQLDGFVNTFNSASTSLASAGSRMIDSLVQGAQSSDASLSSAASSMVSDMLGSVTSTYSSFTTAGEEIAKKLKAGIEGGRVGIMTAVSYILGQGYSAAAGYYMSYHNIGSYLAGGLIAGVNARVGDVARAAASMAQAAANAAKANLVINSPSKVFYKIGSSIGEGFVNAIVDYNATVYNAGSEMADYARKGLSRAIAKVNSVIENGIETQPTIRPVLDLSELRAGTNAIDGVLGTNSSVSLLGKINGINAMMNSNNQNGESREIISAINSLREGMKDLGSSYTINGVTYDDGSNITDAVKTIVRAARIERRV